MDDGDAETTTTRVQILPYLMQVNTTDIYVPTIPDRCEHISYNYEIVPAVLCGMCFVFGILYTFFGYRFFKAIMFLTGFMFGSVVTYLICIEENILPPEGNAGIAIGAGILCGLITMLVQYVGLFLTGFHLGVLLATAGLIVMEIFYHPTTKWISFGILFGVGILFALLTLYFQKGCTIIGTSVFGAAMTVACLDYFVELFIMLNYVWDRIRVEYSRPVCWFSWCILGCWPAACSIGLFIQWKVTGKGFDHHEVLHTRRRRKKVNLQKQRQKTSTAEQVDRPVAPPRDRPTDRMVPPPVPPHRGVPPPPQTPHNRYRHLYQVRRFNGDVISQSYIQSIQHKLSPSMKDFVATRGDSSTDLGSSTTHNNTTSSTRLN
ncbi:transmembrane protein 198-like [Tubulanus polymorphus]|uniref:transmembrane protein 198-like n=1 Tax=Tubulanus polymorphus TaxID=672921 RepID=UPI003DA394CB